MRESVNTITNSKVDPAVDVDVIQDIVFVYKVLGDVRQHDAAVFWSVEWGLEVKMFDVEVDKVCALPGENAVEDEFNKIKRHGLGANVTGVCDVLASDGDARAVGVGLLGSDAAHDFREGHTFSAVGGGVSS